MTRIVDPRKLILFASVTDWLAVYRKQLQARTPQQIMAERKLGRERIAQLRWLVAPEIGYPTEPFQVWRRPALPMPSEKAVAFTQTNFLTLRLVMLERPQVLVRVRMNCTFSGTVTAYAGAPYSSPIVAIKPVASGLNTLQFSGAAIQSLLITTPASIEQVTGLEQSAADDPSWTLMEVVGLPVSTTWSGVLQLDKPQGLVGALGDARIAALDRYRRGAPFYGWEPTIPAGGNAPPWQLANPNAILKVMEQSVLPPLRSMVTQRVPNQHAGYTVQHLLPPINPTNPAQAADNATTQFSPLDNLIFGAATDPLTSLISGFGTAFEDTDLPPLVLADRKLLDNPLASDWDFMVTARYAKGLDGKSAPVEYAAIVFAPGVGIAPPVPANLSTQLDGLRAPVSTDTDWRAIQRVSWDKIADATPFRVGSYAFARLPLAPAGSMTLLMGKRPYDDALQPISATTSPEQELTGRVQALDETYAVRSAPLTNVVLYALAHQDLFGLWSAWASLSATVGEPPVQSVPLLAALLEPTAAGSPTPTALVLEFSWDWRSRSPRRIDIVGRMYAQAKLGDAPSPGALPAVLQTSLSGGAPSLLSVVFNGGPNATVNAAAGLTTQLQYLSADGKTLVANPPLTGGPRRYRLTLTGLSLDFNAAGRIGLALWARGIEERAPNRIGNWSAQPLIASSADPRPPVLVIEREDVLLASIADANGEHHARLEWPAVGGATGYFVYTSTEIKVRADRGMGDPAKSLTLSQRLAQLRTAFANDPERRSFTRVNAQPVTSTSMQVTLPRGSKEIHLYMVLGLSAGQVESAWPSAGAATGKRPICYAAPQIVLPAPPDLEVSRVLDDSVAPPVYRAAVRVRTKPGAAVTQVDIHRVRVPEAAIEIDTMGPPIARVVGSAAPFTVEAMVSAVPGETQEIGIIQGLDPVEGSWRRVFYRAAAWSADDPARGQFKGRSKQSAVREVIIPPPGGPNLAPLSWQWPGGGLGDAQIDTTTSAPLTTTPLGDHKLRLDVLAIHSNGKAETLLRYPSSVGGDERLQAIGTTPPGPSAHGLWRVAGAPNVTGLRVLARRASVDDALEVRMLLTDPLGRSTERLLRVNAGSPLPEPDIIAPRIEKLASGFIVQFATSAPAATTPAGPYRLRVRYTPGTPAPFPQLPLMRTAAAGPTLPGALPQVHVLEVPLPEIPGARSGEDIFADSALIPVRRARAQLRQSAIVVALRGSSGRVELGILSPDGSGAKTTLELR